MPLVAYLDGTERMMGVVLERTVTPLGPLLVTADEVGDQGQLRIETRVNGTIMQSSSTRNMLFTAAQMPAYASWCMTLRPGDVIATGIPEGVGFTRQPPLFLHPGGTVEVEIEQIGVLRTPHLCSRGMVLGRRHA